MRLCSRGLGYMPEASNILLDKDMLAQILTTRRLADSLAFESTIILLELGQYRL